jgi:hypothetical protein
LEDDFVDKEFFDAVCFLEEYSVVDAFLLEGYAVELGEVGCGVGLKVVEEVVEDVEVLEGLELLILVIVGAGLRVFNAVEAEAQNDVDCKLLVARGGVLDIDDLEVYEDGGGWEGEGVIEGIGVAVIEIYIFDFGHVDFYLIEDVDVYMFHCNKGSKMFKMFKFSKMFKFLNH